MKPIIKLTLLLLALLLPGTASAYDFKVNGIYYNITSSTNKTVEVTYQSYSNGTYVSDYSGNVNIPSTVTYSGTTYSVTAIDWDAFYGCNSMTGVTIPNSITSIGINAFYGCSGLTRVNITSLAAWCRISFASLQDSNPLYYAHHLFLNGVEVQDLVVPSTITTINDYAFSGCSGLTSVTIPNSVTTIGNSAFWDCSGLTSVTIPNSVTSIGQYAFTGCSGLTSVTIGSSVTTISYSAFMNCNGLTRVNITDLAAWCRISFESSNANPLYYAYHLYLNGAEVQDLVVPSTITTINNYAFYNCSGLTSVTIPYSITEIGNSAFYGCSGLTSVTIGNSVTSIGKNAFRFCSNLKTVIWGAVSCSSIGDNAFNYSLYTLQFGNGVEHIPTGLPSLSMSGKRLVLPNSVKTIETGAFTGTCDAVVIGNSIENIATGAFASGISVAYVSSTTPRPCDANAFANPQTLYVPDGTRMTYFTSQGWGEFANIIEDTYVRATSITLNKYSAVMPKGTTQQLTATILPSNASATSMTWLSMNPNVATVSSSGQITAVAVGETDIIAMVDNVRATCHVTVTPVLVESLTLSDTQLTLEPGEMYTLTATVLPTSAENPTLEWIIPDNDVIVTQVVNNTRLNIGAVGTGSVTVTARTTDGSNLSASCTVTVQVNASSIALNMTSAEMTVGGVLELIATVLPANATNRTVTWRSSNTSIATVSSNGIVTAKSPGTATITATTNDGTYLSASCSILVKQNIIYATSISLNKTSATITEGNTTQLIATVLPTNATNRTVTWRSSNTSVATVNSNGVVTGINAGSATITATTTDGTNLSASCAVTVQPNVIYATSISLNNTSATITEGENMQLTATVLPTNATNRTVTWRSSNTSVATVNSNGVVTGINAGSATITATTADGTNLSASCTVTVQPSFIYATSISLNKTSAEITEGNTLQLTATVLPTNATNRTVTWSTSNSNIATVNSNGLVTAIAPGSVTITARTNDGTNLTASCAVTVKPSVIYATSISLNKTSAEITEGNTLQLTATVLPTNATNRTVTWSTSNSNIATVNSNGKVTAIAPGLATITARTNDGTNLTASCAVTVKPQVVLATSISLNETSAELTSGNTMQLTATVLPSNASNKTVTWSTSNSNIATVNSNGLVTAIAPGSAIITARTTDGTNLSATCSVTVNSFLLGDANSSGDITITDVVVTARHILFYNPQPFVFDAADVNYDGQITVTDAVRIAYMVLNGTPMGIPSRMLASASNDRMIGTGAWVTGNTGTVSILLENALDYTAFQLDLYLPDGMTACNFRLTDRAGSHTLGTAIGDDGKTRVLCYSPTLQPIHGSQGAVLTFDVKGVANGEILADGIELVTTDGETVNLTPFTISFNEVSGISGATTSRTVTGVDYYNLAGQRVDHIDSGVTIVVTTYSDGTNAVTKVFR